jgi:hypothetical protein
MPSDIRAAQAREQHRLYLTAEQRADQHREQRNRLVRALREDNPGRWTYARISAEVGIGVELVKAICHGRT